MNESERDAEALFRLSVLGDLAGRRLRRGELRFELAKKAQQIWISPDGKECKFSARTLEDWYYAYRSNHFEALKRTPRKDRGQCRAIAAELQQLILDMKREDPGRSVPLIINELERAGRVKKKELAPATVRRLLAWHGLCGPKLELERQERFRWQAALAGELWQGDCVHGPALFDPASGRKIRARIFALIDDKSRLVPFLQASFHEDQGSFLVVLLGAIRRRGLPGVVLLDNHGSFVGTRTRLACARLNVRLTTARPYDGAGKGKIERFFRTLRAHVLDQLDMGRVQTIDELNLRLWAWVDGEYNRRPHEGIGGRTPLEVFEDDAHEVRWPDDDASLDAAFVHTLERKVKKDSTCEIDGKTYEVPPHLRGRMVTVHSSLLHPELIWIVDGGTQSFLRQVDPIANSRRSRVHHAPPPDERPKTGMNSVESVLRDQLHPHDRDQRAEGTTHA